MKIAFLNQPMDGVIPPIQNSIGIWTYQVIHHTGKTNDVIVYGKRTRTQRHWESKDGSRFRFIRATPNLLVNRITSVLSSLYKNPQKPFFASALFYFEYGLQIALDLRREKVDIVHIHNFSQFIPAIRALNPKIKIAIHMHCEWLSQLDQTMIERRLQKADVILGCSEYITDKVRRRFPQFADKCKTLFNGVDPDYFVSDSPNNTSQKDEKRLIFVGRVSPEKGIHTLFDAFPLIAAKFPHTSLKIIGAIGALPLSYIVGLSSDLNIAKLTEFYEDGRDYTDLLRERLPAELKEKVTFTGAIPHAQLLNHYHEADVLINPSLSESFGMSLAEAMASEKPVVATRVGGMQEVVEEGKTGFLVDEGDAESLANAVIRLLEDEQLRREMGKAGRERVIALFAWEQVSNQLTTLYQDLLNG
jgi:glycosyltransferase involved in cell wall biosynthesis